MEDNLQIIYSKLEEFISKYHTFRFIKGLLMLLGLFIVFVLVQSLIEYFNYLNTTTKTILFILTVSTTSFLFLYYIALPLVGLLRIGRELNYKKASLIISKHFTDIEDRLLNTLELAENLKLNEKGRDLVLASLNQRIKSLSPIPFQNAINFSQIKKNIIFFCISCIVLLIIFSFNSKVFTEGTRRLMNYSKIYEPAAPFRFVIDENKLYCEKNKDFNINLDIEGEYIPDNVSVILAGNSFLMSKLKNRGKFTFLFRNVNNDFEFYFNADNFKSKIYKLNVLPAPILQGFSLNITPPKYTQIEPFKILNNGDCIVPAGSIIRWNLKIVNVEIIKFCFQNDTISILPKDNNSNYSRIIRENCKYNLQLSNKYFKVTENLKYGINVIADNYPEIETKQVEDSVKIGAYYFMVSVKDDYGFKDLRFVRKVINRDSTKNTVVDNIEINPNNRTQDIFYRFDFNQIKDVEDDSYIEYYFEVRDNDYLNNYKSARSSAKIYKFLNKEEIRKNIDDINKDRDAALSKSKKLTDDIKKDIEDFKKKELDNNLTDWDKKNFLKSITDKQKELDKNIENILKENKKSNQITDNFYENQQNIIEKQKQIQELLDKILDDELKKMLEEIKKLSEKFNQDQFEKIKDKIDFSYKSLEKKLDRSLELLKRYQVEENVMKLAEDLNKLSEKQHSLSDEKSNSKKNEDLIEKQSEIKKEFENLKNEYKENLERNKDLKNPYDLGKFEKEFNKSGEDLKNLEQEIPAGSKNKIRKKQEQISNDLKNMAKQMESMFNQMEMQTLEMNMDNLRQIIDNLSTFSLNQEENYVNTNKNLQNSPSFPSLIQNQSKLGIDYTIIDDSLKSLMEKVPQMSQLMIKETDNILYNIKKSNELMEVRNRREALKSQRFIINSANLLDLYLDELKKEMEKQKQSGGAGKAKQGKPEQAMENLKMQQQKLKESLQKLLEEMKKEGNKEGKGMNDQVVKSLAEQEIFNKMLQEMQNKSGINPETDKQLKEIKKLSDQNIEDLINKKITPELQNRNQKILTRLLESEKSQQEREQDNKRESKEGVKKDMEVPAELKESLKQEKKYREALQKSNLNLKNYYKNISNDYFRIINN